MLQYDLTGTRLFHATTRADLPGDAEMFVITTALLLYHDVSYGGLSRCTLVFDESDLAGVAECIEYRLGHAADGIHDHYRGVDAFAFHEEYAKFDSGLNDDLIGTC